MLSGEQVEQPAGAHDEHPGVPQELARGEIGGRVVGIGLLDELAHVTCARSSRHGAARLDVAEAGRRVGRGDADRHQPVVGREGQRLPDDPFEGRLALDDVIRGERAEDGVRIPGLQDRSRPANRGHRVAGGRLDEHILRAEIRHLGAHFLGVPGARDDQDPITDQGPNARHGLLDEGGTLTREVVQELG